MGVGEKERESGGAAALFSLLSAVHDHHEAGDATTPLNISAVPGELKEPHPPPREPPHKFEQTSGSPGSSGEPQSAGDGCDGAGASPTRGTGDSNSVPLLQPPTGGTAQDARPADPDAASRRHNWPRQRAERGAPNTPSQFSPIAVVEVRGSDWNAAAPAVILDLRTKDWVQATGTEWIPWVRNSPSLQPLRPSHTVLPATANCLWRVWLPRARTQVEHPRSFHKERLQHMPIKGRNSCKEKEAEKVADIILRSTTWEITNNTPFSVVEQLLLMLWYVHFTCSPSSRRHFPHPKHVSGSAANGSTAGRIWMQRPGLGVLGVAYWLLTQGGTIRG